MPEPVSTARRGCSAGYEPWAESRPLSQAPDTATWCPRQIHVGVRKSRFGPHRSTVCVRRAWQSSATVRRADRPGRPRHCRFAGQVGGAVFVVRDAVGRCGYGTAYSQGDSYPKTIDLKDTSTLSGRITDMAGQPIPELKLKAVALRA